MKTKRSWLALVIFCATTALMAALALAVLFAGGTLAFAVARTLSPVPQSANTTTPSTAVPLRSFTGMVTDQHCGAKHSDTTKSVAECVRSCARNGIKYTLLNGDTSYQLEAMPDQLAVVAGERATISGTLAGDVIRISSITPLSSTQP